MNNKIWMYSTWTERFGIFEIQNKIIEYINGKERFFFNVIIDDFVNQHFQWTPNEKKISNECGEYFPKILQYTGLKDSQGTYLYEGDVLDLDHAGDSSYERELLFFVGKNEIPSMSCRSKYIDDNNVVHHNIWWGEGWEPKVTQQHTSRLKKVGNILLNPELLGFSMSDVILEKSIYEIEHRLT